MSIPPPTPYVFLSFLYFSSVKLMSKITIRMIFCIGMAECEDLGYGKKLEIALDGNDIDNMYRIFVVIWLIF